ncbi:flavin-containing monooxygenase [Williamsia phyllosphaerae]|uniref:Monooxygenase flavin-binding family protein n=1 Tax=Williamsia phyllosphaerae TaxID=885042 RepID=A0ABQ1UK78_9NOCA|nr:NAD(P)/FAD-dependent oxidoreductase [Williamsia phyllosphaerae]GGF18564.1 monooxygenase flavin-binding family protein [Williamsia phyllosphaerae]
MTQASEKRSDSAVEFRDVLIIGAGLSGINAAYRVHERNPGLSYAILERRENIGGTWDLFRYPGVRSDSDIYTLSYPYRPWEGERSIADGGDIRQYLVDTAREFGIDKNIRHGVHVLRADFDRTQDRWTVDATVDGAPVTYSSRFLYLCTGYYDYDGGYTPDFPGIEEFGGTVVHPQQWPQDLEYAGKKVVVIGSGATAITLIPTMSRDAEHVTMLQRSPTYITVLPLVDKNAQRLRKVLPAKLAHRVIRQKNAGVALGFYLFCRRFPDRARKLLRGLATRILPEGYDVDTHFNPSYNPWDQRLCVIPDADLFRAIKSGKADVVTDHIDHFDSAGIVLKSGDRLDADIVVTATGLQVLAFGGIDLSIDGTELKPNEKFLYRGRMLEEVPNFAWSLGYTNASWTLRADVTAKSVAELIHYMDSHGYTHAYPDRGGQTLPEVPALDLQSGYIQRAADELPKSSTARPWTFRQNVLLDNIDARRDKITESMKFGTAKVGSGVSSR